MKGRESSYQAGYGSGYSNGQRGKGGVSEGVPPLSLLSAPTSCHGGPIPFARDRGVCSIGCQTSGSSPTFITAYLHLCGSPGSPSTHPSSPASHAKWPEAGLGLNISVNFKLGVSLLNCIHFYINKQENSIYFA